MAAEKAKTEDLKKKHRDDIVEWAVGIVEKQKRYRDIAVLGRGGYGDVRLMYDKKRQSAIAVKIVTEECILQHELVLWPRLKHPNIVPLLELFTIGVNVAVFVMPVLKTTLNSVLRKKKFLKRRNALDEVKEWLLQILLGLEYLHSNGLCHMDLKVDNVLISEESTALICDFTFLNTTAKPLKRRELGLPYPYRPPEVCFSMGRDVTVDGPSYDMWSYGVMTLEMLTHFQMASTLREYKCWVRDVYPTMFRLLQVDEFSVLMSKTFKGMRLKTFQCEEAHNFVQGFLKVDNKRRTSALDAAQHAFLKRGTTTLAAPDPIWTQRINADDESWVNFKKRCLKNKKSNDENIYKEVGQNVKNLQLREEDFTDEKNNENPDENGMQKLESPVLKEEYSSDSSLDPDRLDEKQKTMDCPTLNSKVARCAVQKVHGETDIVQMAHTTVSDMAAGGESGHLGSDNFEECGYKEQASDSFGTGNFGSQSVVENMNEVIDIAGGSRKLGRRRKLVQWIRNKYLELESVIKGRPYKLLKEEL